MRVCSIIRRASVRLSGGSESARSRNTSTSCPPADHLVALTATADQQRGAALRIQRRPENELIGERQRRHRLHGDTEKVLGASLLGDGVTNGVEGARHCIGVAQTELHATDVGL